VAIVSALPFATQQVGRVSGRDGPSCVRMIAGTAVHRPTVAVVIEQQAVHTVTAGQTVDIGRQPGVTFSVGLLKVTA